MRKIFATILFLFASIFAFAQSQPTIYRVIVPVSAITPETWPGINQVPAQGITWVEPTRGVVVDFLTTAAPPANAIYVAKLEGGVYSEVTFPTPPLVWAHHFAGWDHSTWPVPQPPPG